MDTEPIRILRSWAREMGGAGHAVVLWTNERLPADRAALVNAAGMHVLDFDDTHIPTHVHATAPTAAAVLAAADDAVPGRELLRAVVLGMEVHYAFGRALMPSHFRRGFHVTATGGAVGAAAACSLLLGLSRNATAHAIATALIGAAGLREGLTTMSNSYGVGNAARSGLVAAYLAARGFASAPTAFDGIDGVRPAMSDASPEDVQSAFDLLGRRWTILENSYKRYPTETITQATVEGVLRLRREVDDTAAAQVSSIDVVTAPLVAEVVATRSRRGVPRDVLSRTFDTRYCAAVAWLTGSFSPRSMQPDADLEPRALQLREATRVMADPSLRVEQAQVTVRLHDGESLETFVDGFRGSAATPMEDRDLEAKLRESGPLSGDRARRVIEAVWTLDRISCGDLRGELSGELD